MRIVYERLYHLLRCYGLALTRLKAAKKALASLKSDVHEATTWRSLQWRRC